MKSFQLSKLTFMLVGLGAALTLAPSCKAQSEVSPDHFDGTDPWEIAAHKSAAWKNKAATASSYQAQNKKNRSDASMHLASEREVLKSAPRGAVAVQDKRKVTARKTEKQK